MREYYFFELDIYVRENGEIDNGCGDGWTLGNVPEKGVYKMVHSNSTQRSYYVHRLVARAFVRNPNPAELTQVDHIDRSKADPTSNKASNLRWINRTLNLQNRETKNYDYKKRFRNYKTLVKYQDDLLCLGWYKTAEEAQSIVNAWKEVRFRLEYLSFCTNDLQFWHETSSRTYLQARKTDFTRAVELINSRIQRNRSLRKSVRRLLDDYPSETALFKI